MDVIVAVWSRQTHNSARNNQTYQQKLSHLNSAVAKHAYQISQANQPAHQAIRGIFVAPEYFFAHDDHGQGTLGGGFNERSILEREKGRCLTSLRRLSRKHPGIVILPGTIAWKKLLGGAADGHRYTAARDVQQHIDHNLPILPAPLVAQQGFGIKWHTQAEHRIFQYFLANDAYFQGVRNRVAGARGVAAATLSMADIVRACADYSQLFVEIRGRIVIADNEYNKVRNNQEKLLKVQDNTINYMMRNTAYIFHDGNCVCEYHKQGDFHEAIGAQNDTVFVPGGAVGACDIDGIKFGIEICLDHAIGFAHAQGAGAGLNDIHIIASAAVPNHLQNRSVGIGGHVIHGCSIAANSGVWRKTGLGAAWAPIGRYHTEQASGDPVDFYTIDVEEDFGIVDLFG